MAYSASVQTFPEEYLAFLEKHGAHFDEKYLWDHLRARSYRTLRDGSFGVRCPRHFVPGYDHAVPPGQKPFAHRRASHQSRKHPPLGLVGQCG